MTTRYDHQSETRREETAIHLAHRSVGAQAEGNGWPKAVTCPTCTVVIATASERSLPLHAAGRASVELSPIVASSRSRREARSLAG